MCENCNCGGEASVEKTFEDKVKESLDVIRPMLQGHGGDIELVSIEPDNTVKVRLKGACNGCPGAKMTMKSGVESLMKEKVPEVKEVVAVD